MLLIRSALLIVIGICCGEITCRKSQNKESVYIDEMIEAYNNIEERLWSLVGSSNQSDLVLTVHKEHLNFFRKAFTIDRRRAESYKADLEKRYGWEVQSLNWEIDFVRNFELHETIDDISDDSTVQMAKTYVEYSTMLSHIYNCTVEMNLFEQIKQVSNIYEQMKGQVQ